MPYLTEELFSELKPFTGEKADFLLQARPSQIPPHLCRPEAMVDMECIMSMVSSLRTLRSQLNISPAVKIKIHVSGDPAQQKLLFAYAPYVHNLAKVESIENTTNRPAQSAVTMANGLIFYVPLAGVIDVEAERLRLSKELDKITEDLNLCRNQLSNPAFIQRAPESEVLKIKKREEEFKTKQAGFSETLQSLS